MSIPATYDSILQIIRGWPPAQRFSLVQDVMKTLSPKDIGDVIELTPAQIAEDVRATLAAYSSGRVVEIQSADDLARLIKDSDEDATYSAPAP